MATTELEVAKMALKRVGVTKAITAIDGTDDSVEALTCQAFFDEVRDQVLAATWWPFATKWVRLTKVDATAAAWAIATTYAAAAMVTYGGETYVSLAAGNVGHTPGATGSETWWAPLHDARRYVYAYPNDCVKARFVWPGTTAPSEDQKIPFSVESNRALAARVIVTDQDAAVLCYTARQETVSLWPAEFVSAMAWRLASELVVPLSLKLDLASMALARSEREIARAMAQGLNEGHSDPEPDTAAVAARG